MGNLCSNSNRNLSSKCLLDDHVISNLRYMKYSLSKGLYSDLIFQLIVKDMYA